MRNIWDEVYTEMLTELFRKDPDLVRRIFWAQWNAGVQFAFRYY